MRCFTGTRRLSTRQRFIATISRRGTSTVVFAPPLDFATDEYVARQVFVPSKDGTQIPMFLTHRKDLVFDGNMPTLLYGYGGFNLAQVPIFAVVRLVWLEMGGVLAWANLHGGSEYGETWHEAGMIHAKQNVFDDFISCGEYLIREGITCTPKLAIQGRSKRGPARRARVPDPTPGFVRGRPARRGGDGHVAVPQVHHRVGVGERLRFVRRPGTVQNSVRVLAPAQHPPQRIIRRP